MVGRQQNLTFLTLLVLGGGGGGWGQKCPTQQTLSNILRTPHSIALKFSVANFLSIWSQKMKKKNFFKGCRCPATPFIRRMYAQ